MIKILNNKVEKYIYINIYLNKKNVARCGV